MPVVTRQQLKRNEKKHEGTRKHGVTKDTTLTAKRSRPKKPKHRESTPHATVEPRRFNVVANGKEIYCERREVQDSDGGNVRLLFTHGAGGDLETPAAKDFAEGFAELAPIVSFRGHVNLRSRVNGFHAVIEDQKIAGAAALGGRSLGARAAVIAAHESTKKPRELVLVTCSYPLRANGKNDEERKQILLDLPSDIDVLFIIGEHDNMCPMKDLEQVQKKMMAKSWLIEVAHADHGMKLFPGDHSSMRRKTGELAARWLQERDDNQRFCFTDWGLIREEPIVYGWKGYVYRPDPTLY